jgi:hypothetical protein
MVRQSRALVEQAHAAIAVSRQLLEDQCLLLDSFEQMNVATRAQISASQVKLARKSGRP